MEAEKIALRKARCALNRRDRLDRFNYRGWIVHSEYHVSLMLDDDRFEHWPSRNTFRYRDKTYRGTLPYDLRHRVGLELGRVFTP